MITKEHLIRVKQYVVFALVGGAGTSLALLLTALFTEVFGLWYLLSYIAATLLAWTFNFYLNSLVTFRDSSETDLKKKYFHFIALYIAAFAVNASLVYVLTSLLGWHYLISIIFVTVIISFFTFWWSRYKIFKQ